MPHRRDSSLQNNVREVGLYPTKTLRRSNKILSSVRKRMEPLELQHIEAKLSDQTTPNEEQGTAPLDSKKGGRTTFPFIEDNFSDQTTPNEAGTTLLDRKEGAWITFPFIIGTVLSLTLAGGGWVSNLIVFLITELNVKSIKATQINNVVLGCSSLFPIAGAILADSFLDIFSVITIFASISLLSLGSLLQSLGYARHSLPPSLFSSSPLSLPSSSPDCGTPEPHRKLKHDRKQRTRRSEPVNHAGN